MNRNFARTMAMMVGLSLALACAPGATAATSYKNCKALNKAYPHGVAKSAAAARAASGLTGTPKINRALYAANTGRDRDKDGVACER